MQIDQLKEGITVRGSAFPEPVQIISFSPVGDEFKLIGEGLVSGKVYKLTCTRFRGGLVRECIMESR